MSRQTRLVAAVFALATLMLFFFRSSLWDAQQLRMPTSYEKAASEGDEQKVVEMPVEGVLDEEFKEDEFQAPAEPPEGEIAGLKDVAPDGEVIVPVEEDVHPEGAHPQSPDDLAQPDEPVPQEPTPEEPQPEAPAPAEPQPEDPHPQPPAPEDPQPEEPVPFADVDLNTAPDSEPDSLAFTAIPEQPAPTSLSEATSHETVAPAFDPMSDELPVDWSRFAYTQYVTDSDYLCNSVMIFEALHRLGSKPDRVMMYPKYMLADPGAGASSAEKGNAQLIIKARDEYGAKLVPIQVEHRDGQDDTWADSYTKLLAFNQTQYDRVLSLDSDSTILRPMDELFLMPSVPVAMPRAYWLLNDDPPKKILSSQLILLEPSTSEFARLKARIDKAGENEYDMEIVNELYLDSAMVLPHRPYDLLTAEFRRADHADYLGSDEAWDPVAVYDEAKFVHFSDWPVPKPWTKMNDEERVTSQPDCHDKDGKEDCTERELWNKLYEDFYERKDNICKDMVGGLL